MEILIDENIIYILFIGMVSGVLGCVFMIYFLIMGGKPARTFISAGIFKRPVLLIFNAGHDLVLVASKKVGDVYKTKYGRYFGGSTYITGNKTVVPIFSPFAQAQSILYLAYINALQKTTSQTKEERTLNKEGSVKKTLADTIKAIAKKSKLDTPLLNGDGEVVIDETGKIYPDVLGIDMQKLNDLTWKPSEIIELLTKQYKSQISGLGVKFDGLISWQLKNEDPIKIKQLEDLARIEGMEKNPSGDMMKWLPMGLFIMFILIGVGILMNQMGVV